MKLCLFDCQNWTREREREIDRDRDRETKRGRDSETYIEKYTGRDIERQTEK